MHLHWHFAVLGSVINAHFLVCSHTVAHRPTSKGEKKVLLHMLLMQNPPALRDSSRGTGEAINIHGFNKQLEKFNEDLSQGAATDTASNSCPQAPRLGAPSAFGRAVTKHCLLHSRACRFFGDISWVVYNPVSPQQYPDEVVLGSRAQPCCGPWWLGAVTGPPRGLLMAAARPEPR